MNVVSPEQYRSAFRLDVLPSEFWQQFPSGSVMLNEFPELSIEDIHAALTGFNVLRKQRNREESDAWRQLVVFTGRLKLSDAGIASHSKFLVNLMERIEGRFGELSEASVIQMTLAALPILTSTEDEFATASKEMLAEQLERSSYMIHDRDKPITQRRFTLAQAEEFIKHWPNGRVQREGDAEVTALYVRFVNMLVEADQPIGLHEKAYACYGKGHAGFDEDWVTSRDCLLRLMEIAPDPFYMNTLGYIAYYGRTNGGEPEYEDAFHYFSYGAAAGVVESRYKMADMLIAGKGTWKNPTLGAVMISELYYMFRKNVLINEFDSKFADLALRMGGLYERGIGVARDLDRAYEHYLEARYAIDKRLEVADWYGDSTVKANVEKAIERVFSRSSFGRLAKLSTDDPHDLQEARKIRNVAAAGLLRSIQTMDFPVDMYLIDQPDGDHVRKFVAFDLPVEAYFSALCELGLVVNTTSLVFEVEECEVLTAPKAFNAETEAVHESNWCRFEVLTFESESELAEEFGGVLESEDEQPDRWILTVYAEEGDERPAARIAGYFRMTEYSFEDLATL